MNMKKLSSIVQQTCSRFLSTATENDFFGISHITSKDIAGAFKSTTKLPHNQLADKYRPLTVKREQLANIETEKEFSYGTVRLDKENIPITHGQFEESNEALLYDTTKVKQLFVPLESEESKQNQELGIEPQEEDIVIKDIPNAKPAYRISDTKPIISLVEAVNIFKRDDQVSDFAKYVNKPPLTFYFDADQTIQDDKYELEQIGKTINHNVISGEAISEKQPKKNIKEISPKLSVKSPVINDEWTERFEETDPTSNEKELPFKKKLFEEEQLLARSSVKDVEENLDETHEFDKDLDSKYDVKKKPKQDKPKSALEYLKQVRERKLEPTSKELKHKLDLDPFSKPPVKLDSMGKRDYSNQVIDWTRLRRADAIRIMKESIVYNNYDVVAINKPYGIASHHGDKQASVFNVDDLMQEVAQILNLKKLHLAHRLDKTTTGVLLFAASETMASKLNKLFKSGQITKTYWCITRGIPDPESGIIDIPIGDYVVGGRTRSCLVPETLAPKQQLAKRYREARRAVTEYHTINAQTSAALVEVLPKTGVKHQIRCHLGFGLSTPIIGDHKYTEIGSMAPQKLPNNLLKDLKLRQQKVRTLPLHLHAKTVVIPDVKANGQTLFVNAPLPDFFIDNLKSLKLFSNEIRTKAMK